MGRKQKKITKFDNHTLDRFMKGLGTDVEGSIENKNKIHPKIKIPATSGYQPNIKAIDQPFIYPQYGQFREYQYQIALQCVTHNTLVCLPTGLGKTHIASVIICNYYKWFPEGKIFFMAPTRPLVDQQFKSLLEYRDLIKKEDAITVTGSFPQNKRLEIYKKKRIFFCTPQTLQNDLLENRINKKQIVLLIADQAHKATGNYAYSNIVRILDKQTFGFRIIGLSATPGNTPEQIQQVLQNLLIAKLAFKSQQDSDVKKYLKNKKINNIYIQPSQLIRQVGSILDEIAEKQFNILVRMRLCSKYIWKSQYGIDVSTMYQIRVQYNSKIRDYDRNTQSFLYSKLTDLYFLAQGKDTLKNSGYQSFMNAVIRPLQKIQSSFNIQNEQQKSNQSSHKKDDTKISDNLKKILLKNEKITKMRKMFASDIFKSGNVFHPKMQKLSDLLVQFFQQKQNIQRHSKAIVFAQYRNTCFQIMNYLQRFIQIKVQMFYGQSKTTVEFQDKDQTVSTQLKMNQKQQKKVIQRFKNNQINTLVSTSIGEQGLDIGQVDCIVCYDGGQSMIRNIQRMGRTGRKRDGNVYVLLMEGKQSNSNTNVNKRSKQIKSLLRNNNRFKFYGYNPSMFQQGKQIQIKRIKKQRNIATTSQIKQQSKSQPYKPTQQQNTKQQQLSEISQINTILSNKSNKLYQEQYKRQNWFPQQFRNQDQFFDDLGLQRNQSYMYDSYQNNSQQEYSTQFDNQQYQSECNKTDYQFEYSSREYQRTLSSIQQKNSYRRKQANQLIKRYASLKQRNMQDQQQLEDDQNISINSSQILDQTNLSQNNKKEQTENNNKQQTQNNKKEQQIFDRKQLQDQMQSKQQEQQDEDDFQEIQRIYLKQKIKLIQCSQQNIKIQQNLSYHKIQHKQQHKIIKQQQQQQEQQDSEIQLMKQINKLISNQ